MADTLDILTLVEGYRAVNDRVSADAGQGSHDAVLSQWITGISRRVDDLCGPVVQRTVTAEHHQGGEPFIVPRKRPVVSVTTIKEYAGVTATTLTAEDLAAGTVTGNDYWVEPSTSFIYRRSSGGAARFAPTRVILTYEAGRAVDTASVDPKFKAATAGILQRMRNLYGGAWSRGDPFAGEGQVGFFRAVDPMINEFLGHELRMV